MNSFKAKEYREKVEKELRDICNDVLVSSISYSDSKKQQEFLGLVRQIFDCQSQ